MRIRGSALESASDQGSAGYKTKQSLTIKAERVKESIHNKHACGIAGMYAARPAWGVEYGGGRRGGSRAKSRGVRGSRVRGVDKLGIWARLREAFSNKDSAALGLRGTQSGGKNLPAPKEGRKR